MARYTGPVCRICRREGMKLFLKGERCYTDKCAIERRNYPPGQHGQSRPKFSEYSLQLREKQKLKRMYGMLESQFEKTFKHAERGRGITGESLLILLERRLDNLVYRLGFASSRAEARQLVGHGHVRVNGRRVDLPSFLSLAGDVITLDSKSSGSDRVKVALEGMQRRGIPDWLELMKEEFRGTVKFLPRRSDLAMPVNEKLIVELYSK